MMNKLHKKSVKYLNFDLLLLSKQAIFYWLRIF